MARKPDYRVGAMNKETDVKAYRVGGAWKNDNGTITVILDAFVIFPGGPDTLLTLFPNDDESMGKAAPSNLDKEIPF